MRLPIDAGSIRFLAVTNPERVIDFDTKQPKADTDGQPLYGIRLCAINGDSSEIISVKLSGNPGAIVAGDFVNVTGLVASPWETNGRSGISYRADKVELLSRNSKAS